MTQPTVLKSSHYYRVQVSLCQPVFRRTRTRAAISWVMWPTQFSKPESKTTDFTKWLRATQSTRLILRGRAEGKVRIFLISRCLDDRLGRVEKLGALPLLSRPHQDWSFETVLNCSQFTLPSPLSTIKAASRNSASGNSNSAPFYLRKNGPEQSSWQSLFETDGALHTALHRKEDRDDNE